MEQTHAHDHESDDRGFWGNKIDDRGDIAEPGGMIASLNNDQLHITAHGEISIVDDL